MPRPSAKGWMLRSAPRNEDYILAVARTKEDLEYIAGQYIRDIFEDQDYIDADVDFEAKTVTVSYGTHEDLEGNQTTLYISEVEILGGK